MRGATYFDHDDDDMGSDSEFSEQDTSKSEMNQSISTSLPRPEISDRWMYLSVGVFHFLRLVSFLRTSYLSDRSKFYHECVRIELASSSGCERKIDRAKHW